MTRVFIPEALHPPRTIELPAETARHLVTVLRMREGEAVTAFDGHGAEADARLVVASRQRAAIALGAVNFPERESPLQIHLGLCISKGERMDAALQKSVELGVHAIAPLSSERSVVRLDEERWDRKHAHWQAVVLSACEQSGRLRVPAVAEILTLPQWTALQTAGHPAFVCTPDQGAGLLEFGHPQGPVRVLVGPEGGLSPAEVELARRDGFRCLRMGPRTLRAETASIACVAAMQTLWGDLG